LPEDAAEGSAELHLSEMADEQRAAECRSQMILNYKLKITTGSEE
jgi:hypothetical protein